MEAILIALITALVPSIVTLISNAFQNRQSRRHSAKQSILQMIMEDEFGWETFSRFPTNYGNIQDEYMTYHKNGGNGEVTKKVHDYNEWYVGVEEEEKNRRNK